jgi:predicted kinase
MSLRKRLLQLATRYDWKFVLAVFGLLVVVLFVMRFA